jgi:hypothetical protein
MLSLRFLGYGARLWSRASAPVIADLGRKFKFEPDIGGLSILFDAAVTPDIPVP